MTLFKILKIVLSGFLTLFFLYLLVSNILLIFSVNENSPIQEGKYEIFIFHDRAHTEIILNTKDPIEKLQERLQPFIKDISSGYLAFSYGDRHFMLYTKEWKDLETKTALKALFLNTPAVIRIGHYKAIREDNSIIKIRITQKTLEKLQTAIIDSFGQNEDSFIRVKTSDKEPYIYYFRAKKPYNLFYTCNTYTGDILRKSSFPVSLWTPLSYQVVYHFPK